MMIMRKKKLSEFERFMSLSDAQKDREVSKYDSPGAIPTKPLRAKDKALHRKAAGRSGRPRIGEGAKIVPVSIEGKLLRQADAFAREHRLKRSEMVARGLRLVMAEAV
jgi:hypothetical protein